MSNISHSIKDWSTTEASNQPDTTDAFSITGDLRAIQVAVRSIYSQDTIASATTCDIGSKDAGSLTISGTTTITGLGTVSAGVRKVVTFSGALTLTYNATSLILPGNDNITTVAGDTAEFESLGSGNWRCNWYQRDDGSIVGTLAVANGGTGATSAANARTNLGAASSGENSDITSLAAVTDPLSGLRNIIINPGFTINQRGYVSAAALAAGSYGHDRWKAGASGGDYSFTQLASNTQITIATGKSLIQVVEDKNVHSTRYVLSWEGTAQARTGVNSATPSGSYAASPIVITGQTAGTTMSVEFNEGTLGKVQLKAESSLSVGTPFEPRPYGVELSLCQRYYESKKFGSYFGAAGTWSYTTTWIPKRSAPTISLTGGTQANVTGGGWNETDIYGSRYSVTLSGAGGHWNATLTLDSEL